MKDFLRGLLYLLEDVADGRGINSSLKQDVLGEADKAEGTIDELRSEVAALRAELDALKKVVDGIHFREGLALR